jgi:enoyl-CoA hydratase
MEDKLVSRIGDLQEAYTWLADAPYPTIAAIRGYALGGGLQLALACDLRIVARGTKLALPEHRYGLLPDLGGTFWLPRIVGPAKAKELIFTGRFVAAQEALAIGLVDQLHPADEVYAKAVEWAAQFVDGPALALRAAKNAVDRGLEVDLQTGLDIERTEFAALWATDDQSAGMSSFIENGPGKATFSGS